MLEGVIDRQGYSPHQITVDATLSASGGGDRYSFSVVANRTNLNDVVSKLTRKVMDALRLQSTAAAGSATEESLRFYNEAKWAVRWGLSEQAKAAAEAAW